MASKTYILCPGQGAQAVGMGKDFYQSSAVAREVFEKANAQIGFDLRGICFEGPQARLDQTDVSQPALYVAGVASYRAGVEAGAFEAASITAYAGLSLGEYTALHLAGAFSFEEGLRLVSLRGRYMQEAATATPSGMLAVIGGEEAVVRKICEEAAEGQVLVPANFNSPGQIVISGDKAACERAVKVAEAAGVRAVPLAVAGAFHSPIMAPAAERMKAELDGAAISTPAVPVYSNVTAEPHSDVVSIKRLLVEQIVQPVRWAQTMTTLAGAGEARFIELAPGRTLAGLLKRVNRRIAVEENAGWKPPVTG
ncbi:MAG: ACP S-malonyltransferase [Tepidisphaeraceae bacterium]|jgi:[acyl-carrier-protein] S-malonyltransferase